MIVESMLDRRAELRRLALHQAAGSGTKRLTHSQTSQAAFRPTAVVAPVGLAQIPKGATAVIILGIAAPTRLAAPNQKLTTAPMCCQFVLVCPPQTK